LLLQNNGTEGSVTFSVQEAEGPPAVAIDGTITPSTTPGTTGGLSLDIAEGDSNVKVFSFEAEAGKRYSAVIYKLYGGEYASLDCSFSDAYGAGEVAWGGGTFGLEIEGLPSDIYEAGTTGTHYLNVQNWSGDAGSFVVKIYSNTPAAPVLSPDSLPENTTTPTEVTITSADSTEIYYYYPSVDDTRYSYSGPFEIDIDTWIIAYAVKDGIYSDLGRGDYWFQGTKYPSFSPTGNIQPQGTIISITGAEEGDTVYYTTDGTNPYNSSTRQTYTEPSSISVGSDGLVLQAIIKNANGIYGNTGWHNVTKGTAPPSISNIPGEGSNPGTTGDTFDAILASSAGSSIYYTLDGTEATAYSTPYTVPIPINSNTRIRAIAIQDGIASTELNQFLNITEPRTINVGETVQGMSYGTYPEWFTFTINDTGTYNFTVTPENEEHGFIYYSDWWSGTYNDPVVLYDSEGAQLHRFVSGSGESISDPSVMKYNFTNTGTYRLSVSSKASQDERFSIQIDQGIKPPVPGIPVDSYSSMAYIKEGSLTLATAETGGRIFYTLDGTDPAMVAGVNTFEFLPGGDPIPLTTTDIYKEITVKAITVINAGTENASAGDVQTFTYIVVPGGLDISSIVHGPSYYTQTFASGATYGNDSYKIRLSVPGSSYAGYPITSVKYELKMDESTEWIEIGTVTGSAIDYDAAYDKFLEWSSTQTPYAGNATLRATASDVVGNSNSYSVPIVLNMAPPTTPQNLTATPGQGSIKLTWEESVYPTPNKCRRGRLCIIKSKDFSPGYCVIIVICYRHPKIIVTVNKFGIRY
jgi:hypothetical protein